MVKKINREGIQRMVRNSQTAGSRVGGGGGGGGLSSVALYQLTDVLLTDPADMDALVYSGSLSKWVNYSISDMATKTWVGQNYLSIAFFNRLFKAYNGNTQVNANDTTSTIDNIKAMFGFWTEAYITALGSGGSIGSTVYLSQLADVALSNPTDGQALVYDATTGKWKNGTVSSGVDMTTVWNALAASTNEQINYSHLSGAVAFGTAGADYVPITIGSATKNVLTNHQSVADNNPTLAWNTKSKVATIGSTDIHVTMMAKPTYNLDDVNDGSTRKLSNYLPLSGGTMTGAITMKANQYQYDGNYALNMSNSDIVNLNAIYTADTSDSWSEGIEFKRTNDNWDSLRALDGTFYLHANNDDGYGKLYCADIYAATHIAIGKAQDSYNTSRAELDVVSPTDNPAEIWLGSNNARKWSISCRVSTDNYDMKIYNLDASRYMYTFDHSGNFMAIGGVTALSDIRKKDVVEDFVLKVADIAKASLIKFTWKDKHDTELHAGGIAQEWQKILPESVRETAEGELAMDYGVIAVAASVSLAREVVELQKKVNSLEARIARLEKMFAINNNDIED